jgi:O-antigen/teichoic acid export membrane protein
LQYADVILAGREFSEADSSAYAAASVAAKVTFFISLGLALHVLPESARRAAQGERPIRVLRQALGLLAVVAVPAMVLYAFVPDLLLRIAFGDRFLQASDALVVLGAAYTLLGATYLAAQYLLALHRSRFVAVLVLGVVAEIAVLTAASGASLERFAALVLAVQTGVAAIVLGLAAIARPRTPLAEPADGRACHERDHPGEWSRLSPERGDGDAPEVDGGDRGQADPVGTS